MNIGLGGIYKGDIAQELYDCRMICVSKFLVHTEYEHCSNVCWKQPQCYMYLLHTIKVSVAFKFVTKEYIKVCSRFSKRNIIQCLDTMIAI